MSRHTPYLFLSTVLLLTASACAGDDASSGSASESSGSTTSAADDGPALGERASQLCRDAMASSPALVAATNTSELAAAYEGGPLQDYVLASDAAGERGDDAAILAALADGGDEARASVVPRLQAAFVARVRAELAAPEALVDDPDAAWSEAHCLWTGALASLAAKIERSAPSATSPVHCPSTKVCETLGKRRANANTRIFTDPRRASPAIQRWEHAAACATPTPGGEAARLSLAQHAMGVHRRRLA